ncbi:hypothetical protein MTO96_042638 [Rhipicephalus appendiculatus]
MSDQENLAGPSRSQPSAYPPEVPATPNQFQGRANDSAAVRGGTHPKQVKTHPVIYPQLILESPEEKTVSTLDGLVLNAEKVPKLIPSRTQTQASSTI